MVRTCAALMAACLIAACGGGGAPSDLLVVGNSITRHAPIEALGWKGDWGMAASSQAKDFAHLTGAALGVPVTAINAATLETDSNAAIPALKVGPATVVVLELGDNPRAVASQVLVDRYSQIVTALKGGAQLACVSTWWRSPERDAVIKAECEKAGGTYVYIGDLFPVRRDKAGTFTDPGVDAHPQDWSMARIAERVTAALQTQR